MNLIGLFMTNKKITFLGLNGRGGTLQYSSNLVSYMSKHSNVALLLPSYSDTSLISKKVKLIRITAPPSALKTLFLTINIFAHIKTIKSINNTNSEIIDFLDIHPWYVLYWPFLKGKKYVTINDPEPHAGEAGLFTLLMIKFVTKFLLKRADKIIVLGSKQELILRQLGYKQEIIVSRIGSYDFFNKYSNKKYKTEPQSILFFGRIKLYKGLDYLLDALIELKHSGSENNFKLIIAGEGDISVYWKKLLLLGESVELHNGYIGDEDVNKYFQRAAFIVMPYIEATQTGVVQVAYSFKKPVIATNVGSLPEVVINKKTGIIIEPKNVNQLKRAMITLLKNPKLAKKYGQNSYNFMKKELDWKKIVKKLVEDFNN